LCFLGQKEAALEVLRPYQPNASHEFAKLCAKMVDYCQEPVAATKKNLLEFASRTKGFQMRSHLAIGLRQLVEGDRASARQHFQEGVAVRQPYFIGFPECRALLARMQKDPTWPPWIPVQP
jgi:hypothetical protein